MDRKDLIHTIVDAEWMLFDKVDNIGGRAACQDDYLTFHIMRDSQFAGWDEAMLASYADDLSDAREEGRNLLSEKYAHMMERTDPMGYERIKEKLPAITDEKQGLIDEIAEIGVNWQRELMYRYPRLSKNGRAIDRDEAYYPSFETYLRGELATYSEKTLSLYLKRVHDLLREGANMNEMILAATVSMYGYKSLEEAENAF